MAKVLKLSKNIEGRDFVIGDIHGAYALLIKALEAVDFDPEKDRVISVGDLIDRGPDSPLCLAFLEQPWFYAVRGNHEDMFLGLCTKGKLDAVQLQFNIQNGMGWLLNQKEEDLLKMEQAFSKLPIAIEVQTDRGSVGFVHADVPDGMEWQSFVTELESNNEKIIQKALWSRSRISEKNDSGVKGIDRLFFGHTPQTEGVKRLGNCYYIDTGAVFGLANPDNGCVLTISDIMAKTQVFSQKPKKDGHNPNIIDKTPIVKKTPFTKYNK